MAVGCASRGSDADDSAEPDSDVVSEIEIMAPCEYTPELRSEITEAIASLERIGAVVAENAKRMSQALERVDRCLAERVKHTPEGQKAA